MRLPWIFSQPNVPPQKNLKMTVHLWLLYVITIRKNIIFPIYSGLDPATTSTFCITNTSTATTEQSTFHSTNSSEHSLQVTNNNFSENCLMWSVWDQA
jgi:hypothetical protein